MKKDITKQKTFTLFIALGFTYFIPTIFLAVYYLIRWLEAKTEEEKTKCKIEVNKWGKTITFIIILFTIPIIIINLIK